MIRIFSLCLAAAGFAAMWTAPANAYVVAGAFGTHASAMNAADDQPLEPLASAEQQYSYTGGALHGGRASASLLSGTVRATAWAENGTTVRDMIGGAGAIFWDRVTFYNNDPEDWEVYLSFKVDGVYGGGGSARARFYWGYNPNFMSVLNSLPNLGWVDLANGETVLDEGIFPVILGAPVYIYAELIALASTGTTSHTHAFADFGSTGRFEWQLAPGMTYTSASGVFMSAAAPGASVPEPATLALVAAGLVGIGWRRRRAAARRRPRHDASLARQDIPATHLEEFRQ